MIYVLLIIAPIGLFLGFLIWNSNNVSNMIHRFSRGNVIVFGRKGCGKDLIFQAVIRKRNKAYSSNIDYGYKGKIEEVSALNVEPNTYEEFIKGNVQKIVRDEEREERDFYISDGGVFLPSQYDTKLDKEYKSFPIFYALSRHLYNMNVHVNTQALSRVWKKLREQADSYVQAIRTYDLGLWLVTKARVYEKYESAEKEIAPFKASRLSAKEFRARKEEFRCNHGEIFECYVIQTKRSIKYDTRYFKRVLFEE